MSSVSTSSYLIKNVRILGGEPTDIRIADGRIAEMWMIWDNMTVLSQLGHFPG